MALPRAQACRETAIRFIERLARGVLDDADEEEGR